MAAASIQEPEKAASPGISSSVSAQAGAAQPAAARPATTKPAIRSIKSTVKIPTSLQGARQQAVQKAEAESAKAAQPENPQPIAAQLPDKDYTPEQLMQAWNEYAEQVKAAGRQGEYIVLKEAPVLADDHVVQVRISNSVQKDFFEKAKPAAQLYLRKALQNSRISLEYIIVKEEEGKRLYTGQEKFGYLLKKYPHLKDLKERLGLEADF